MALGTNEVDELQSKIVEKSDNRIGIVEPIANKVWGDIVNSLYWKMLAINLHSSDSGRW